MWSKLGMQDLYSLDTLKVSGVPYLFRRSERTRQSTGIENYQGQAVLSAHLLPVLGVRNKTVAATSNVTRGSQYLAGRVLMELRNSGRFRMIKMKESTDRCQVLNSRLDIILRSCTARSMPSISVWNVCDSTRSIPASSRPGSRSILSSIAISSSTSEVAQTHLPCKNAAFLVYAQT